MGGLGVRSLNNQPSESVWPLQGGNQEEVLQTLEDQPTRSEHKGLPSVTKGHRLCPAPRHPVIQGPMGLHE